jgi:hypothetical protein
MRVCSQEMATRPLPSRHSPVFERAQVEDHLVDNERRPVTVVAEEVLHRVGWLHHAGGQ